MIQSWDMWGKSRTKWLLGDQWAMRTRPSRSRKHFVTIKMSLHLLKMRRLFPRWICSSKCNWKWTKSFWWSLWPKFGVGKKMENQWWKIKIKLETQLSKSIQIIEMTSGWSSIGSRRTWFYSRNWILSKWSWFREYFQKAIQKKSL